MNRRDFLKAFGTVTAGAMAIPLGASIVKKHTSFLDMPDTPESYGLHVGDTIVLPHKDGFDKIGIYYVNSIDQPAEVIVIDKVFLDRPDLAPIEGDVFLHMTSSPEIVEYSIYSGYTHYEEQYTHELYEITSMVKQDHTTGKYSFNYKLSKTD